MICPDSTPQMSEGHKDLTQTCQIRHRTLVSRGSSPKEIEIRSRGSRLGSDLGAVT